MSLLQKLGLNISLGALLVAFPTPVFAKDIPTKSAITKVTVFPNGAEITRLAKVELDENGDHVLVLEGLPQGLNPSSLRVKGKTTGQLEIGSVDHKVSFTNVDKLDKTQRKAIEDRIEGLKDQRNLLDSKIKISQSQKELIEGLAKLPSRPVNIYGQSEGLKQDWPNLFDMMGEKLAITYNTLHETRIARRLVSKDIDKLLKQLEEQPNKKIRQSVVRINLKVSEAAKGDITVRYQIRNAGWQPIYDARLATTGDKPALKLVRMASIYQHSSEAWDNVNLLLSTTRPTGGVSAPRLRPLSVEFAQDIQQYRKESKRSFGYADKMAASSPEMMQDQVRPTAKVARPPTLQRRAVRVRQAKVNSYAFQTTFEIAGKVSIKPNGQRKKLKIMTDDLRTELEARSVPKRNLNAYLYANFELPAKATPLLPGRLFLFRDGIFVGKGHLPQISPSEKHEMGFGVDDKIKVKFAELKRNKGETGLFTASKTDKRQFKITVKNLHDKAVQVKIIDQIPYTTNEKILIEMLSSTTKPTQKNVKDKRGILEWKRTLKAGQEDIIKLDYQISWPSKGNRLIYR